MRPHLRSVLTLKISEEKFGKFFLQILVYYLLSIKSFSSLNFSRTTENSADSHSVEWTSVRK